FYSQSCFIFTCVCSASFDGCLLLPPRFTQLGTFILSRLISQAAFTSFQPSPRLTSQKACASSVLSLPWSTSTSAESHIQRCRLCRLCLPANQSTKAGKGQQKRRKCGWKASSSLESISKRISRRRRW